MSRGFQLLQLSTYSFFPHTVLKESPSSRFPEQSSPPFRAPTRCIPLQNLGKLLFPSFPFCPSPPRQQTRPSCRSLLQRCVRHINSLSLFPNFFLSSTPLAQSYKYLPYSFTNNENSFPGLTPMYLTLFFPPGDVHKSPATTIALLLLADTPPCN